jgi:hypothetical protein
MMQHAKAFCGLPALIQRQSPVWYSKQYGDRSAMVINVGLYAACFLSLYVLNATKLK